MPGGLHLIVSAPKQNRVLGANKHTAPAQCSAPQFAVSLALSPGSSWLFSPPADPGLSV